MTDRISRSESAREFRAPSRQADVGESAVHPDSGLMTSRAEALPERQSGESVGLVNASPRDRLGPNSLHNSANLHDGIEKSGVGRRRSSSLTVPCPQHSQAAGRDWRFPKKHLLDIDNMSRQDIEGLLRSALEYDEIIGRPNEIRERTNLEDRVQFNVFFEPSTRTRSSFELAGKALGMDVLNFTGHGSSVDKGESLVDTITTIADEGADVIVMRHSSSGAPYLAARAADKLAESGDKQVHIVNAGDGQHAHPTQALVDTYVLRNEFGTDLSGLKVAIVGDILHSRVARSNLWALTKLGAEVTLVAPRALVPSSIANSTAEREHPLALPVVRWLSNLEDGLKGADVVMPLRIQRERMARDTSLSERDYARRYMITKSRLDLTAGAVVLHPGPKNDGIEIASDVAVLDSVRIRQQVKKGRAVRLAILVAMLEGGHHNG